MVDDIDDLVHQELPRPVRADAHSEPGVGRDRLLLLVAVYRLVVKQTGLRAQQ